MKLKINSSFVIANLVVMPLISIFITYFFLRGNNDVYDYIDTYLKQSKVIKLFPAKSFVIQLEGRKGEESEEANGESHYKQE